MVSRINKLPLMVLLTCILNNLIATYLAKLISLLILSSVLATYIRKLNNKTAWFISL